MSIMRKKVKTHIGIVDVSVQVRGQRYATPEIRYTASINISGNTHCANIDTVAYTAVPYSTIENDLLMELATQLIQDKS